MSVKSPKRVKRPTSITMHPSVRDAARRMAEERGMSLSFYLETLVREQMVARGIAVGKT